MSRPERDDAVRDESVDEARRLSGLLKRREQELARERRLRRAAEAREQAQAARTRELARELGSATRRLLSLASAYGEAEAVRTSPLPLGRTGLLAAAPPPLAEPIPTPDPPAGLPPRTAAAAIAARRLPFTVTPLGGAEEVGGSALLVESPHGTVLLDAGQRVKGEYGDPDAGGQFHFLIAGVERLDGILVSHAHVDHVGSLPVLVQEHARAQGEPPGIWMSEPTAELAAIMMHDSAKVQAHRARHERNVVELAESDLSPNGVTRRAYEHHDVNRVLELVQHAAPDHSFQIPGTELVAKLQPVSHVLGSCAIHLKHLPSGATLLYTGDLGPFSDPQETLHERVPGHTLDAADVVVMESTYGRLEEGERDGRRRRLAGRERVVQRLSDASEKAFEKGGFVLLPSFSLGRTQELLRLLGLPEMPSAPIYLGGMGERITTVYSDWGKRRDGVWVPPGRFASGVTSINGWVRDHTGFAAAAAEVLEDHEPGYVICSPAMLSGGWSRAFLELMIEEERHAIAFTGYLPSHAGNIRHIDRVRRGQPIHLADGARTVRCDWLVLKGLSAHAPAGDLRRFALDMARGRPAAFACVHGDKPAQEELAGWISEHVDGASAYSMQRGLPWNPRAAG